MINTPLTSWGRYPYSIQKGHPIYWQSEIPLALADLATRTSQGLLAYGCGRSYGDSCLAQSDHVLSMSSMNHLIAADWDTGLIVVEAGLTLAELTAIVLPRGWFLPVTPGTKFVTLGGAVANDVHGKNHHVMGTFGCHVKRLSLYRSGEGNVVCSPAERPELFAATVGGLGLTGVILAVELQLRPVLSNVIEQRTIRFESLNEFFSLSETHNIHHEYTVAWLDCLTRGKQIGRGHFIVANHMQAGQLTAAKNKTISIPFDPPFSVVNPFTLKLFNTLYYHRHLRKETTTRIHFDRFFYPLDGLLQWNRIYGRAGFQQYQCAIPQVESQEIMRAILKEIAVQGTCSFLAVLKQCGSHASPGLLSFPLHGVTLALDFPQQADSNNRLFARLDALVHEAGGRLYPAKDAHMSAIHFKQAYPAWEKIEALRDPHLLSKFWQRVTQ
ncbi:FAD-binding oxidoreductase [soil metagenome]